MDLRIVIMRAPNNYDFLHYVSDSREDMLPPECDERLKHLHRTITEIKSSTQTEVAYMKMEERDRIIRDEGMEKGRREGRREGLIEGRQEGLTQGELKKAKETALSLSEMGLALDKIALALKTDEKTVQMWLNEQCCIEK